MILAGVCLFLASIFACWGRNFLRAESFGDRAADSLQDSRVAAFVADRATDEIIAQRPQLLGARPLVLVTVQGLLNTAPCRALVRRAARRLHSAVFSEGGQSIVLSIPDIDVVLRGALLQGSPQLAAKIPDRVETTLASLGSNRQLEIVVDMWRVGLRVRLLARLMLLVLTPLLLAAGIWVAVDRRRALVLGGISVGVAGLAIVAMLPLGRLVFALLIHEPLARGAAQGVYRTYLGGFLPWGVFFIGLGVLFTAAGSSLVERVNLPDVARVIVRRAMTGPPSRLGRIAWGAAWLAGGIVTALFPHEIVAGAIIILGLCAAFIGVRELFLVLLELMPELPVISHVAPERKNRIGVYVVVGLALLIAIGWVVARDPEAEAVIPAVTICNGHPELCDRRVDQVVFPAAHNSMSNAEIADWMFPHHQAGIAQQLQDGIRVLLLDVHRGFPGAARIKTDIEGEQVPRELLVEALGEEGVEAAMRIRERLVGADDKRPGIYLCHGFCELGGYEFEPILHAIRDFMIQNPNEVLIIVLEDYVTVDEIVAAFESSGLSKLVYQGPSSPWPTLGELIDSGERLIVFLESGHAGSSWLRPTIGNIQETPYHFVTPDEFSCKPNRGGTEGSLFQVNHWIQTTPAPKLANATAVNAYDFLLQRVRNCEKERGRLPNIIAVDFYRTGGLFAVVDTLNLVDGARLPSAKSTPAQP